MAKGGGTGSRNKQKKKSDTTQNGSVNGPTDIDQKMNNKSKHRKQKDETPPINHTEEEVVKEEKVHSKLQPTSEQLRLAHLTQDTTNDPQRREKINKVIDFTGKSEDEVATALYDCSWDVERAIELLLEEGGDLGSWEETGKKKKKKQDKEDKDGKENEDWDTDNFEPGVRQDGDNRDKSRGRGPPRFKRGGGMSAGGGGRQDGDIWKNKEWQENERNFEGGRGRGGRGMGSRSRGGMPPRQRGRGGGPRQYGANGTGGGGGSGGASDSGPFGQIDTWNPNPEDSGRRGKISNRDAFENAGNWGDDFPAAEDWDNDEYTGSLSDTKVFTPSGSTAKSAVGEPVNPAPGSGAAQHSPANNSLSGASYGQQIDLSALLQKPGVTPGVPSAAPGGPTGTSLGSSLSQFNQTATQDLKTAIGIGGPTGGTKVGGSELAPGYGSSALSYSTGSSSQFSSVTSANNSFGSAAPGSAFSPIKPAAVTNGSASSKALPRARLPPPSKIPSSAVEMPGESLSNLDVQFGGLDLQFGGNSEASSAGGGGGGGGSGFDFSGGSSSLNTNKDIDSKYSIPVTSSDKSLDNFKSASSASVKDVNQSLNNALSAAGIKPSGSTDSVGYSTNQRTDSKPSSNFSSQRSPGPQSLERTKPPAVTDSLGGYNNSGYPYQSSSQSKSSNQFGHPTNSYSSTNNYERQNSSGYSSTNGLSSTSYGSSSGAGFNSSNATSSNSYSTTGNSTGLSNNNSYNSAYNVSTAPYSSYTGSNSYSSKSSSSSTTHSQYPTTEAPTSTPASTGKFETSVTGSGYPNNNFGLTSSMSKMSVNSTSSKMLPNLPPGVASMIPQYMIGAGAGTGFPAYLAAGLQQPMYGYGGVGAGPQLGGVSSQQLEDLAALQRSSLANLPQLVGSGSQAATSKGASTGGYYDPSSQFGTPTSLPSTRGDGHTFTDSSKFGQTVSGVTDSTSSPAPSTVAQPTAFNALASTFAAAPTQHPTLPPGYAYFYGGMAPQLQAAYGQTGVYPTHHPGIAPTAAGATATTQFQKQGYNNYDSLALGQNSSDYGKTNFASQAGQAKGSNSSTAGHWYGGGTLW